MFSRNTIRYALFLAAFILGSLGTSARQIPFASITTDDGLSHMTVNDMYVDEYGMIWIATREGLNRYDGNSMEVFLNDRRNPESIPNSKVLRVTGDRDGHIWMICSRNVACLDLRTMKFRTVYTGNARAICWHEGCLYIGVGNELLKWDESSEEMIPVASVGFSSSISNIIFHDGELWLGTEGEGIWRLNPSSLSQECLIPSASVTKMYVDSGNNVWAGTWNDGLYGFMESGGMKVFRCREGELSSDFVRCCCEDETGKIWIGTFEGLDCYDPATGRFDHHISGGTSSDGINHSSVWCIIRDRQGNMWLGTYYGGVNCFNPESDIYTWYRKSDVEGTGLSSDIVGCIQEDSKGNLWIATEGGGVNYLDRKTGKIRWYTGASCGLSSDNVKSLYYDENERILWAGTHLGGLNRIDVPTGRVSVYRTGAASSMYSDIIRDIVPYGDSLILATSDGVYMFDTSAGRRRRMFDDEEFSTVVLTVPDLYMDRDDRLWVAVNSVGVICHDMRSGRSKVFRPSGPGSLSGSNVNEIMQDSSGRMWFSMSGSGVDMYDPAKDIFVNYDSSCGLMSDCVFRIVESSTGTLMMTAGSGIFTFDPQSMKCVHYNKDSGFPMTAVNANSLCITEDSTVFLGGISGMLSFREGTQDIMARPYGVTFTKLIVNGREVEPGDHTGILENSLCFTSGLEIGPEVSIFTLEFATSNYLSANSSDMVYCLEGFSDRWTSCRGSNMITWSNLSAGNYRLVIKSAKHDESICPPAYLNIKVLSPWYLRWWALFIWTFLAILVLVLIVRSYNDSVRLRQSLEYEKRRSDDVEALNQTKLRFFTNISHEIKTPLTVIIAQVENLMNSKEFTPSSYRKVLSIYKNSVQLKGLISELLEFRKQEQGKLKLKVGPHDIVKMVTEFHLVFEEYAKARNIVLTMECETNRLEVWYDRTQFQKVLRNLLSNALKYTGEGGAIKITLGLSGNDVVLSISDTGCGMSEDEMENIFTRFYRVDSHKSDVQEGTGIGLALVKGIVELHHGTIKVESAPGEGSVFTVTMPLGYSHFSEDELIREEGPDAPEISMPQVTAAPGARDRTMLVIDDNESIRKLLVEIFEPFYNVIVASDGAEGWEICVSEMPDIVVTDVLMPRMNGIDLCRRIKSDVSTCHIPVVMLTARVDVEQNIEGILKGADDYIAKPFDTRLLISRCNNLVNSRIMLQEKFSRQPDVSSRILATNSLDKDLIDKATAIIEKNMDNPDFNINMFAHEMAMSRTNLFAKMKAVTGQTPNDFVMTLRLKRGAHMLKNNPELSIAEIADRTGFGSSRYFSKCFNDLYHIRPLNYRKGKEE